MKKNPKMPRATKGKHPTAPGVESKTMNLSGPEAFKMKAKKPEPDDRPRPMRPAGKPAGGERAKRNARLAHVKL